MPETNLDMTTLGLDIQLHAAGQENPDTAVYTHGGLFGVHVSLDAEATEHDGHPVFDLAATVPTPDVDGVRWAASLLRSAADAMEANLAQLRTVEV